jgi:hypothetical protein
MLRVASRARGCGYVCAYSALRTYIDQERAVTRWSLVPRLHFRYSRKGRTRMMPRHEVKLMPYPSCFSCLICLSTLLAAAPNVLAQGTPASQAATEGGGSTEQLAKAAQNSVASLISVPVQNNSSFGIGPFDRTQNVLNIQPVRAQCYDCRSLVVLKPEARPPEDPLSSPRVDWYGFRQ